MSLKPYYLKGAPREGRPTCYRYDRLSGKTCVAYRMVGHSACRVISIALGHPLLLLTPAPHRRAPETDYCWPYYYITTPNPGTLVAYR